LISSCRIWMKSGPGDNVTHVTHITSPTSCLLQSDNSPQSLSRSNMSRKPPTISVSNRPEARRARALSVVSRTSQPSSNSESADRTALALGVVSTTLAALNDASRFVPFPAFREATGLTIALFESAQVSTDADYSNH